MEKIAMVSQYAVKCIRIGLAGVCLSLVFTGLTWAVTACPGGADVRQPDGNIVTVFLRGDERAHWHEDANGFAVMKSPVSGFWVFGREDGGVIRPTEFILGRDNPVPLGLVKPSPARISAAAMERQTAEVMQAQSLAPLPPTGTMRNLVVLVSFSDMAVDYPRQDYDNLFNQIGYTVDGAAGSVKDYYHEVSYNNLTVQSTVVEAVTLDNGYAYYGANDTSGYDRRPREMVSDALAKLEARGFDFTTVDGNNDGWTDGWVDGLTIIHAGGGEEYSGNDPDYIWSHQWALISPVTYDGVSMQVYHTEPARRGWDSSPGTWGITRIGVICHENGHFLGLPDLYDYGYDSSGAGDFCLMAGGSWNGNYGTTPAHMSAWCKSDLGWVTPTVISSDGSYTLLQVENNAQVYKLQGPFAANEYFLVENRQGVGFDAGIPGSSRGILIWHVDENQPDNDDQTHYKVDLEEAGGTQHLEQNLNQGEDSDYYRAGNATIFSDTSTPDNKSYSGISVGLNISNVSATGASMSFDVSSDVAIRDLIYSEPMNTFAAGWTFDPGLGGSKWEWGTPNGGGGQYGYPDPSAGNTGMNVVGYNLSGDYRSNIPSTEWAATGAIDCSNYTDVQLRFYRWLNVESPSYDHASIEVSNGAGWTQIWSNSSEITDSSWYLQALDISGIADEQATVYVRWGMGATDKFWRYSGWNIDDVELWGTGIQTIPTPPTDLSHSATAINSITWSWTDNSDNEDGFRGLDEYENEKWSAPANVTEYEESPLTANTPYTRQVTAYNTAGQSDPNSCVATVWTLSADPYVSCNRQKGNPSWPVGTVFTFTNEAGFGSGGVEYYRYSWNQNPNYSCSSSDPIWSGGVLNLTADAAGKWYLHLLSYNGAEQAGGSAVVGSFHGLNPPNMTEEPIITAGLCNRVSWEPMPDASDYFIECADDSNFDTIIADSDWINEPNYIFCNLLSGQIYWYRVKARTAGNCESQWSNVESSRQCGTPGDFEPDCDVDVVDLSFLLSHWLDSPCGNSTGDDSDWCYGADLNRNGKVDLEDVAALAQHWLEDFGV